MKRSYVRPILTLIALASVAGCAPDAGDTTDQVTQAIDSATAGFALMYGNDGHVNTSHVQGVAPTSVMNAPGDYTVTFAGLASGGVLGNAQVAALGLTSNRCQIKSHTTNGTDAIVRVYCTDYAGNALNSSNVTNFIVAYDRHTDVPAGGPVQFAYLAWDDVGQSVQNSYNGAGATNSVVWTGSEYQVTLPHVGQVANNNYIGHEWITSQMGSSGQFAGSYCNIRSRTYTTTSYYFGDETIYVRCFSATGAPARASFSLGYGDQHSFNYASSINYFGYYMSPPSTTGISTFGLGPNNGGGAATMTRNTTGQYTVTYPGLASYALLNSIPMVSAYGNTGSSGTYCSPTGLGVQNGTAANIVYACYNSAGQFVDSGFLSSLLTNY